MAFPEKLLNSGEHVVVHTRSHPKALLSPLLVLVVLLAVGAYVQRLGEGSAADLMHLVVWVLVALVVVWWVVRPVINWATTTFTFTNRRFIKRSGLLSKEGRTIPLNRISGVDFEIGVIDRIFGCGTLVVSDASETGIVPLHDIPDVEGVQLKVAEELHRLSNHRNDDGT
ncbi:PH domain-containing protein [Nocardioides taihuensis]|uniref:PH domain-containing protein n=1 Tax=Nocardioides taihuensis TaxID=1835606 RepID=A0ABW0BH48_9ACTN